MYTCTGTRNGYSAPHQHVLAIEAKACFGLVRATVPAKAAEFRFGSRADRNGPLSVSQFNYIRDLGGDTERAKTLTYAMASDYIQELKNGRSSMKATVTPYIGSPPPLPTPTRDPRLDMVEALIDGIPDGYFAVGDNPEREASLIFLRFSRPKRGRYAGSWKFQQVIGTGLGYRLEDYVTRWPSGSWIFSGGFYTAPPKITNLMLICADHVTAAILYARYIKRCARCNATLTDERSRWWGIGPECEKHWPQHMEMVEATKGPYR